MVKHCKLCRIEAVKGGERSFHRFPDPQYQREAWCQALEIDVKMLKNWIFVCSDHFPPECFIYRSNGQRFLKDDAIPLPYKGQLKRIGRRKKGYRTKILLKDDDDGTIKECNEQEIVNVGLDRLDGKIKVENPDYLEESDELFKPKYLPVKTEIITTEECNLLDIKSEENIKQSERDSDENFQSKEIPETKFECFLDQASGEQEKEDIIPKLFNLTYPKLAYDGLFLCKECTFQTFSRQSLIRHFIVHRETEFRNDPEKFKEYKKYPCKQCNYVTIRRYNLSKHMIKHQPNDEKPIKTYSCNECDYLTKYHCNIVKHQLSHIPTGQRFHCTNCSYKAYSKSHLKEHMEKGHIATKQYKYECEQCLYKTDSKCALDRHVRESHSKYKPFKYECKYCSFKIDGKASFNRHMKHHHSEVSLPPVPE